MIQTEELQSAADVSNGKDILEVVKSLGLEDALSGIASGIVQFTFRMLLAILVFYIGKFIIKKIYGLVYSIMVNRKVDASLTTFVLSLVRIVLYFILIITIVGIIGIETSSFLALFASAGVAIGMALSGTLQNFAGGVLILLLKPDKVGDFIEAQGFSGTVKEIQIFHTVINTGDNKAIIIPNGGLSTGSINNYSLEQYRRVDWVIGLSYGTDYAAARKVILSMLDSDERVVKKYIDDDVKQRLSDSPDANVADVQPVEEKKGGWWSRFRSNRKRRHQLIEEKLREQISMNEGLPVKKDCTPFVGLSELAASSINIVVRAWTHSSNYWGLYFEMNERFYKELPERGFSFPFPQMDVHISDDSSAIK